MKKIAAGLLFFVILLSLWSCREKTVNPNVNLTLEDFDSLSDKSLAMNSHRVRAYIRKLISEDSDSLNLDNRIKSYYDRGGDFLWINRHGIGYSGDTLVACLDSVDRMGMSRKKFRVEQIKADLHRMHALEFDDADNTINKVLARLEYNLTKGYLRYVSGQRFGFINPTWALNRIDTLTQNAYDEERWTDVHYRQLYDIKMEHSGKQFYRFAMHKVAVDSIDAFLHEVETDNPLYWQMKHRYNEGNLSVAEKRKLLINMERCRWRVADYPWKHKKYVLVNIPSMHLLAVDDDESLSMRVGLGTTKTKTPLLISHIKRMDINPKWILPRSIMIKSVLPRVGNRTFFERNHYFVKDKSKNERVPFEKVTRAMLLSGDYVVMQEGGKGNSLGRIIFRFDNNFSVFLHSTSNPNRTFSRSDREVSHGCVRVERPFDLAVFLLEKKDRSLIDKIGYSMSADISPAEERLGNNSDKDETEGDEDDEIKDTLQRDKLIYTIKLQPTVPLFILYFTVFPDKEGRLIEYDDIYGYDDVIWKQLLNFR